MTETWKKASELAKHLYEEEHGVGSWDEADKYEREDYQFWALNKLEADSNGKD